MASDRNSDVVSSPDKIAVAIMDGREIPGFWLDAQIKRYRALRSWHIGELICLDDHWLDTNGFSGVIDVGGSRHWNVVNGRSFVNNEDRDGLETNLSELLDVIESRARNCGLERRWVPTQDGPIFAKRGILEGDPVLVAANADEGELAVAAQPRVLVALVAKVRELLAFVDKVDWASPDLRRPRDESEYDNARMELDVALNRLRRIEVP